MPGTSAGVVFAAPAPADYRLDQAVAALVLPTAPANAGENRAGGVRALFDLGHPSTWPFPSNWFTVFDDTQNTWRRVNMPLPDCTVYVSDCSDLRAINELDGFNLQPRLSIPFSGPIDVNSVNSQTVFLVSLGSTTEDEGFMPRGYGIGINQVVWDVATNTLHVGSDELLAQHTRFALYVTTGVLDTQGNPVGASEAFRTFRETVQGDYREHLHDAMLMAGAYGFRERDIATASVFTTQSITFYQERIRDQIKAQTPKPADFLLGPGGSRTLFARGDVAGITWRQQNRVNPPAFNAVNLNVALLDIYPGAVDRLAFGKYVSPDYRLPTRFYPTLETRSGIPQVQRENEVYFNLLLPSGPAPAGGWPMAITAHGNGGNKNGFALNLAASLAAQGVATIAINHLGHGFGPLSTLTVNPTAGDPVTFSAGGRSEDVNGDNTIGNNEGSGADANRQIGADLMQLVRVIEVGMDADGDGTRDLDPARVYYVGNSLGGTTAPPSWPSSPTSVPGSSSLRADWGSTDSQTPAAARRSPIGCRR